MSDKLRNIKIGCSFAPELMKKSQKERLEVLHYIHQELKITDFRLGLRWNRVEKSQEMLTLEFYRPYLDYCFKNNLKISLNIGPIKVMRWPEAHLPVYVLHRRNLNKGENVGEINIDDDLSKLALDYLDKLLTVLKKEYGKELKQVTFQPENEMFYPFGDYLMTLGFDHTTEVIKKILSTFPKNKLMINSAGRLNLNKIFKFLDYLWNRHSIRLTNKLTIGINYYYKTPLVTKIPFITTLDPIIFSPPWSMSLAKFKHKSKQNGYLVEVSEAQFEPWLEQTDPGNKLSDFLYLLSRNSQIFPLDQKEKVIRLWGIEHFVLKLMSGRETKEHRAIKKLIIKDFHS